VLLVGGDNSSKIYLEGSRERYEKENPLVVHVERVNKRIKWEI